MPRKLNMLGLIKKQNSKEIELIPEVENEKEQQDEKMKINIIKE